MKIYLTDQKNKFKQHLDRLKTKRVSDHDLTRLKEKIALVEINSVKKIDQLNLDFLFEYKIFPDNIMTYKTQWADENRKIKIGDTIVQQVYIPPTRYFSQKIIFGVRINEIIDEPSIKGFSYETLEGHVETGISTFRLEQIENRLIFKIHSCSAPGNFLAKLAAPFFSLPYQTFCTKSALNNVKRQLEKQ